MTLRRVLCAAVLVPAVLGLLGCASTTGGTGHTAPPGGTGVSTGQPAGTQDFIARLAAGVRGVTTAHVTVVTSLSGTPLNVVGDETLKGGTPTAYQFSEQLPANSGLLHLVFVGGKTYAQVPPSLNQTGKPWVLVTPTSSNVFARTLASTLGSLQSSASVAGFAVLGAAATDLQVVGDETVNGVESTHYSFTVDVAKLPDSFGGKSALQQAGITTVPLQVWLDAQNRPVRAVQTVTVSGSATSTTVNVGDYNKPLTISAPPASQVSTD